MEQKTRVCHWCSRQVGEGEYCQPCLESFPERPAPETMTADEREAEFRLLTWIEVPIDLMRDRINALLGRPFWSHEMGPGFERLAKEVRWEGRPSTMQEISDLIPAEKRILVSLPEEEG